MKRDTKIQPLGEDREIQLGAAAPAIYRTSLFTFPDAASLAAWFRGDRARHVYSRDSNPTVGMLEEKFADLEKADGAVAFASGMGAISAVFLGFLRSGDELLLFSRAYGPTLAFARDVLEPLGVTVTRVDETALSRLDEHIGETTRLIYVESPASVTFEVPDLRAIADVARRRAVPTACDNSWATPVYQQPLALGIDITVHSGTKYIGGHSDVLLGLAAGTEDAVSRIRRVAPLLGASLSPDDAALAIRGLRTLPLRMERHRESAILLARRLEEHRRVESVRHPGLESFPTHDVWKRQLSGSSGVFSFVLDGDPMRFADALEVFRIGVSWGGHESLVLPVEATRSGDPDEALRDDLPDGLVRLSVGLEDPEDLWADVERGLAAAGRGEGEAPAEPA